MVTPDDQPRPDLDAAVDAVLPSLTAVSDDAAAASLRRTRVALAEPRRGARALAWLALGPRRRGSRADRARVCAGALAQSRAGAGIDRRAAARESGGRHDPARTVHAAGRASAGRAAARRERRARAAAIRATPQRSRAGDVSRADDSGVVPAGSAGRARARRAADSRRTRGSAARPSPQSPCPCPTSRSRRSTWRRSTRRQSPTRPPNPSPQENRDAPFVPACRLLARGPRSAVDAAVAGAAHDAAGLHRPRRRPGLGPCRRPPSPSNQNVRIDVTISLKGDAKPLVKSLSMVAGDGKETQGTRRHRDSGRQAMFAAGAAVRRRQLPQRRRQRRRDAAASSTRRTSCCA